MKSEKYAPRLGQVYSELDRQPVQGVEQTKAELFHEGFRDLSLELAYPLSRHRNHDHCDYNHAYLNKFEKIAMMGLVTVGMGRTI